MFAERRAMRSDFSNCIRGSFGPLLLLSIAPALLAQAPQIDSLGGKFATSLARAKLKSVLVFDFVGPEGMDAVGQTLAADFRTSLAKSGQEIRVQDYSELLGLLKRNGLVLANLHNIATARWIVGQTDVDAWAYGTLSNGIGGLKITVDAYPVKAAERYIEFDTSIPLTDDLKALVREREKDESSSPPGSGENGYSYPACLYCPIMRPTTEALRQKFSGTVVLELTVDSDGHPQDITVKVGLPFGWTQKAIEALKEWRLKPAIGPDGKPAAVREAVELSFSCS
jgi:Gram-negative bacterial TonB protein C-terminal